MYQNKKRYALTNCVLLDGTEHMALSLIHI